MDFICEWSIPNHIWCLYVLGAATRYHKNFNFGVSAFLTLLVKWTSWESHARNPMLGICERKIFQKLCCTNAKLIPWLATGHFSTTNVHHFISFIIDTMYQSILWLFIIVYFTSLKALFPCLRFRIFFRILLSLIF